MFATMLNAISNAFTAAAGAVKAAAAAAATYLSGAAGAAWGWLSGKLPGICIGAVASIVITYAPWLALAASVAFLCYWVWTKHLDRTAKQEVVSAAKYIGFVCLQIVAFVAIWGIATYCLCWALGLADATYVIAAEGGAI